MPASIVKSFAKDTGKSVAEVEKLWDKAKGIAKEAGREEDYDYITGILKKMLGLNEADNKDSEEYQTFFKKKLKKYGVDEPDQLSKEQKKKFFDEVDREWKSKDEKSGLKESLPNFREYLKEEVRTCPECGATSGFSMERCKDGNTTCGGCGYKGRHGMFWSSK